MKIKMFICPDCKGVMKFKIPSSDPLHVYNTDAPTVYDIITCSTCKGKGKISELEYAIYKARGGPAPPLMQIGF
jgi:hypothetical protein